MNAEGQSISPEIERLVFISLVQRMASDVSATANRILELSTQASNLVAPRPPAPPRRPADILGPLGTAELSLRALEVEIRKYGEQQEPLPPSQG